MPNIGVPELILILVIALIVFGPKKLPEVGRSVGKGLREFRRASQEWRDEFDGTFDDEPVRRSSGADTGQTNGQASTAHRPAEGEEPGATAAGLGS